MKYVKCYFFAVISLIFVPVLSDCVKNNHKLSILIVVPEFPKIGDVCMLNQIILLHELGHNVTIFARRLGQMEVLQKEVKEYNLMDNLIHTTFPEKNINTYDVIIFQLGHLAFNVKKEYNFKGKIVICLRGYDISAFIKNNPHAYDEAFNYCDLFLPVCDIFKKRIIELGADSEKVCTLHSAIDYEKFYTPYTDPLDKKLSILSACRFIEKKGIEYAIYALKFLSKQYPLIHYTIIGGGKEKKKYQTLIKKLDLEKHITIKSWVNHDELAQILHETLICLVPSISAHNGDEEGIPNIVKEAMAAQCFVVSTAFPASKEILFDQKTGFFIKEKDPLTIAYSINKILQNSTQYQEVLTLAQKIAYNFDKHQVKSKLNYILTYLVKNSQKKGRTNEG